MPVRVSRTCPLSGACLVCPAWCRAGRKGRQAVVAVCRRRCGCGVSACVWMVPIGLSAVVSRRVSCGCRPSGSVRFLGVSRSLSSGWMTVFPRRRQAVMEVVSVCGCRDWWRPAWTAGCHHVCAYIMAGRCHCLCGDIMALGHPVRGLALHYSCRNSMAQCPLCVQSYHGGTSIVRAIILWQEYPIFVHGYNGRTPVMRAVMVWPHVHCSCMDIMVPLSGGLVGTVFCRRAWKKKKNPPPGWGGQSWRGRGRPVAERSVRPSWPSVRLWRRGSAAFGSPPWGDAISIWKELSRRRG